MDPLERWFRSNIDDRSTREEREEENEAAKDEQLERFCELANLKEED
jgi:hypothetical protein